jgi:hypothetical protein
MQDKDQRQTGDSTKKVPQQQQGGPKPGQQGGQGKGDHNQRGKNNEQSKHTEKGKGL